MDSELSEKDSNGTVTADFTADTAEAIHDDMPDVSKAQVDAIPCYASYAGFYRFMTYLTEAGVPRRIETRRVPEYAKNDASRVIAGLFAMGLINEDGFPEEGLHKLVSAFGTVNWAKAVNDILPAAYPYVPRDLRDVTSVQLKDVFSNHIGKDFASLRNVEAFFLGLASDGGFELSPSLAPRAEKAVGEAKKWIRLRSLGADKAINIENATPRQDETALERHELKSVHTLRSIREPPTTFSLDTKIGDRLAMLADMLRDQSLTSQERNAAMLLVQAVVRNMNAA